MQCVRGACCAVWVWVRLDHPSQSPGYYCYFAETNEAQRSAAAAAVMCMYALCSTVVMGRVSIDDIGARCAVRMWGVLCRVRVARSPAPEPGARVLLVQVLLVLR